MCVRVGGSWSNLVRGFDKPYLIERERKRKLREQRAQMLDRNTVFQEDLR